MIMSQEQAFLKAQKEFDSLCQWVRSVPAMRIDEVERELFGRLLAIGLVLLRAFVARFGRGDAGAKIEHQHRQLRRSTKPQRRRYVSIFGPLTLSRFVYARRPKQKIEHVPLDAQLGLPASEFSYVLQDWQQRLCLKESFGEAVGSLFALLGIKVSVRSAEAMNRQMAQFAPGYRPQQESPPRDEEGQLLVVAADGKGGPMRRPLEERIRSSKRRGKGEKKNKKQMAYVGAVYTIDRFRRTSQDVIDDLARKQRAVDRPLPQHKHVYAEMTLPAPDPASPGDEPQGKPRLFAQLAAEVQRRRAGTRKPVICLMDGERALWEAQREHLPPQTVGILDLYHVLERLWTAAHCFHGEGTTVAERFVNERLQMLLDGRVGYLIGGLRRMAKRLRGEKRRRLLTVIGYLANNRSNMRYDEYLAEGYPIGSGVAEGACRHVVKDRLEQTGMRWTVEGAQAILHLRAIYLNGDWDAFLNHRIQTEQKALYGQAA